MGFSKLIREVFKKNFRMTQHALRILSTENGVYELINYFRTILFSLSDESILIKKKNRIPLFGIYGYLVLLNLAAAGNC